MHPMLSVEFLDKFRSGQRTFDGILLQYCDLSGNDFSGLNIKNSKLFFSTFRNCDFGGASFENCEMFFAGFRGSNFRNVCLKNCKIEYSGLSVIFDSVKMSNCVLNWVDMLESSGRVDMTNCIEFRVFRSFGELTPELVGSVLTNLEPIIQHMDLDMQEKVRNLMKGVMGSYKIGSQEVTTEENPAYSDKKTGYGAFDSFIHGAIDAYEKSDDYRTRRNAYERKDRYRH